MPRSITSNTLLWLTSGLNVGHQFLTVSALPTGQDTHVERQGGADLHPGLLMQMCDVELAAGRMGHQLVMLFQDLVEALQAHCTRTMQDIDDNNDARCGVQCTMHAKMLLGAYPTHLFHLICVFAAFGTCICSLQGQQPF